MIVTLIPFFLAANIPLNVLEHGPEYVFQFEMYTSPASTAMKIVETTNSNATAELICRPKKHEELSLRCQLGKIHISRYSKLSKKEENIEKEPIIFEIKFNDRGVDGVIVPKGISIGKSNMIRTMIDQLTIGYDLTGKPDGEHHIVDTTYLGECNFTMKIKHHPLNQLIMDAYRNSHNYILLPLSHLNKVPEESIEIEKIKMMENCIRPEMGFFGNYIDREIDDKLNFKLISSMSKIIISDEHFKAFVRNEGSVNHTHETDKNFNMIELSSLLLKSIRPAEKEWPEIWNPERISFSIEKTKSLDDFKFDSFESMDSSQDFVNFYPKMT